MNCGGYSSSGKVRTVVLHSTEGSTAEGGAAYLHQSTTGSVQIVVDDKDAFRLANDSKVCCGVGGFNDRCVHIEQAGFASWSRKQWLRRLRTLRRAAYWTAVTLKKHDIPCRKLTVKKLREGRRSGYTYHRWIVEAGLGTSTHTDPGPHYPYTKMDALIQYYYRRVK